MEKFYLTTAIAYTSGVPHIGNVYEAILADCIVRYKRFRGFDCYFQTGTDEHGQKIEDKAKEAGISPQVFVDGIAENIKEIYKMVGISYDRFIRTTDTDHKATVQKIFKRLYDQNDIYKGYYEGNYCKDCESFFTETQLVDGCCPDCGAKVTLEKEEAYFMSLSKYQDRLVKHINDNPEFIQPESRKNEMLNNFLSGPLPDLCVSRTSFKWGVPVEFDTNHVVYVWIDALSNYISGLGYSVDGNHGELFKKYWPANVHLIGKDILRFHTIYWPIMLMALDVELPKQVFGHPWILFDNNKMSKSKGNVLYTKELVEHYGVDALRYYVLHEIPFAQDGNLTHELIIERTNTDLANTLGNLVNRTITMQRKYFPDGVSHIGINNEYDRSIVDKCYETRSRVDRLMDELKVGDAIEKIVSLLRRANKYIDENEPWKLAKDENSLETLENVLYNLLEAIRYAAVFLSSFIPETSSKIFNQLNIDATNYQSVCKFGFVETYNCNKPEILFKRIDLEEKMAEIVSLQESIQPKVEPVVQKEIIKTTPKKAEVSIDDFDKLEIVVGEILECKRHENADRLLVSQINIGSEVRQVVSGIAKYYEPNDLIGKKVCVITNLKEVEIRKVKSYGMVLCASKDDKLEVVEIHGLTPGAIVK